MKMTWVTYAVIATLSFTVMFLLYKKLLSLGLSQIMLNLTIFGLVFLGFVIIAITIKTPVKISNLMLILIIITSVLSLIANYFQVKTFDTAPNIGYALAIISGQIALITILSSLIFKSDFNLIKFIGILVVIFGIYMISK